MTRPWLSAATFVATLVLGASMLGLFAWSWGLDRLDPRLLGLAGLFTSLDLADLLFRLHLRRVHTSGCRTCGPVLTSLPIDAGRFTPAQIRHHLAPYAIIASVHNAEAEIDDFLDAIEPFRDRVWVIDDASTDRTAARLDEAGVNCVRSRVNQRKPKAIRDLLDQLDPRVVTVIVMDPDSRFLDCGPSAAMDLERVIFEFQQSGMAALCPCLTVRDEGMIGRLQQLEYWLSFNFGRHSLYDHSITSGIAVYRRDALAAVLAKSSSVYAEDLKNAYLLFAAGERVYYDGRLIVETAGKDTWPSWFSQRVGWYFGLLKVYVESMSEMRKWAAADFFLWYHFVFYTGIVTILLHPLRVAAFALLLTSVAGGLADTMGLEAAPVKLAYFLLAYAQGTLTLLIALALVRPAERRDLWIRTLPAVPFYFFYALAQTLPITLGYLNWLSLRLIGRRIYRDHFDDDATLRRELLEAAR